jgi:nucleoside-diphosphate-sugar epimerase
MKKETLLLGSGGYIGSTLYYYLNDLVGVDVSDGPTVDIKKDYNKITKKELKKYKNIILLAGHPNPASCFGNPKYSFDNNITKFINLLKKISKGQKLIYASSSCVYDSKNGEIVDESCNTFYPASYYDITKKVIDYYACLSDVEFYSLRFGSVNGLTSSSLIMRDDIVINSMTKNAIYDKKIKAVNPEIHRAILGILDLCKCIKLIINGNDNRGIYNLSSINSTVGEIAKFIGNKCNAEIDFINNEKQKIYDFQVSSEKFCNIYDFKFSETLETITNSIINKIYNITFVRRDKCIKI